MTALGADSLHFLYFCATHGILGEVRWRLRPFLIYYIQLLRAVETEWISIQMPLMTRTGIKRSRYTPSSSLPVYPRSLLLTIPVTPELLKVRGLLHFLRIPLPPSKLHGTRTPSFLVGWRTMTSLLGIDRLSSRNKQMKENVDCGKPTHRHRPLPTRVRIASFRHQHRHQSFPRRTIIFRMIKSLVGS